MNNQITLAYLDTVYEKNHAGIRFYERHGFKKIGIKHFPLGKQDRICPILEKEI